MKIRIQLTIVAICCLAAFVSGYSQHTVRTIEKIVIAEHQIPVCAPLLIPQAKQKYANRQLDLLAAAVPASALRGVK